MKLDFLITADVHFEKLNQEKILDYKRYITESFAQTKPEIFIIAGDTCDSRTLQVSSDNYLNLVDFLKFIESTCKEYYCEFIILKGTPSHDGDVIKNICDLHLHSTEYIDTPFLSKKIKGYTFMFIPEVTYPTYKHFIDDLKEHSKIQPDVVIYHNMIDFAIPQLKQIDSEFNLGRSVIIDSSDFRKYFGILSIGGHVHSFINQNDIYYTGTFTNKTGHPGLPEDYGFVLVKLDDNSYETIKLPNKYIDKIDLCRLDFDNMSIEEIINTAKKYNRDSTLYQCVGRVSKELATKMSIFKESINPKYIRKSIKTRKEFESIDNGKYKERVSAESIKSIFTDMFKEQTKRDIPKELSDRIFSKVEVE